MQETPQCETLTVTAVTTHTGAVTLSPTGSNTVLTVGGVNYSVSTVQATFTLPSTPVFTGAITLSPTGSNTVLTVSGTNYSASAIQTAFALPSTPVFTGNITLLTNATAPIVGQLGYTTTTF